VAQVVFRADVALVMVEVHPWLCISSMSVDSLPCNIGKEVSWPFDSHKPLPGAFTMQPANCYARETKHLASTLLRLRQKVSELVNAFPLFWPAKTVLWPFWPYCRQNTCRTVQGVPDLLVLP
jgi:hypothetical protein